VSYKKLAAAGTRAERAAELLRKQGKSFTAAKLDGAAEESWRAAREADPAAWRRDVERARKA
jgi:hypothetical protein